jgi:hypothetical protein
MRISKKLLFVFAVIALSGCKPIQLNRTNSTEPYTQPSTGMYYPSVLGNFQKASFIQYAPDASDISVGYNLANSPVSLTVYSYPVKNKMSANAVLTEFEDIKRQILTVPMYENNTLLSQDWQELVQVARKFNVAHAKFSFVADSLGEKQPVYSDLYLLQSGNNFYQYRITYPQQMSVDSEVQAFMRTLTIPVQ